MKKTILYSIVGILATISFAVVSAFLLFPSNADAQTGSVLYLSPPSKVVGVGSEMTVDVMLNTGEKNINSVTASLTYDPALLRLVAIDSSQSVFPSQAEEVGGNGVVRVTRFKLPPAVSGQALHVTRLRFKALASGKASISFVEEGSARIRSYVIDNDVVGENVLANVVNGRYDIVSDSSQSMQDKESGGRMYISPSRAQVAPGSEFPVDVLVDTDGRGVHAVSAYVTFDNSRLELIRVDNNDSAFAIQAENDVSGNKIYITRGARGGTVVNSDSALVSRLYFKAREGIGGTAQVALLLAAFGEGPSRIQVGASDILVETKNAKYSIREVATEYFEVDLEIGSEGEAVRLLQQLLIDEGVYPEALVTGYFGPLTKAAVVRFQEKYANEVLTPVGLSNGTGYVGPTTRAKLNAVLERLGGLSDEIDAPGLEVAMARLDRNLSVGSRGVDVEALQQLLIDEGVYPEALVTGYFGPLTKAAVVRFQEKYANEVLTPVGLSNGTGYVGPSTRAKINSMSQ